MDPCKHNVALVQAVANALRPLREQLVFVGGCALGLLVKNVLAQPIRMTVDVGLIAEVRTLIEFHQLENQFVARGFNHDQSANAEVLKWMCLTLLVGLSWVSEEMSFEGAPLRPAYVDSANQALARFCVSAAINPARTQLL